MVIELKNVNKSFINNTVLKDVNLNFEDGKIYGFVGRNGSGKTVLLKLLCGYMNPTSGDIIFDNKVLNKDIDIPPQTRCLIENPQFLPHKTGYQNLKLLADILKLIGKEEIEETLKKVNLYDEKDKMYHKYSLGMKQKLGIAQVLMEAPHVIILDEPFNGIEDETAKKLRELLIEEKKKGKIIILATHIKDDIEVLVDVLYQVKDGMIERVR
ncbi:MAG TPA: ATP-binding cassette domain-containing protein [Tenericutes bacterium]|nr:ATP-binding cassette domain-containing protein [Mycoplasmatota bacterium]